MENFNKRLLYILESNDLSASQFATKIGVQRSSVSHVLSGRNKPSLDFLIKISDSFENISIDWLVKGILNNDSIHSNNVSSLLESRYLGENYGYSEVIAILSS
jgi:transcriptional regulator with XRE-family HTH domain